jgi:hyperosmotically inducible periplasmic protein
MFLSRSVVVPAMVVLICAGCRSMTGESVGQNIDDATITTSVKSKLADERASTLTRVNVTLTRLSVTVTRVSVATANGTVSLTGIVPTAADRERAEAIAWRVKGVHAVANNLQVDKQHDEARAFAPARGAGRSTWDGE